MTHRTKKLEPLSIGIDLGDKLSHFTVLDKEREILERDRVVTTPQAFKTHFARFAPCLVAIEAGTHSLWAEQILEDLGHQVVVANPRRLKLISENIKKTDDEDSEILARAVVSDLQLIKPVIHRDIRTQKGRTLLRLRDAAVRARTSLITCLRGSVKPYGLRLPTCSTDTFHRKVMPAVPPALVDVVSPLVKAIAKLSAMIVKYDQEIEKALQRQQVEAERLMQVSGVGPVTAFAFLATIDDPKRFTRSRRVASYLGLTPKLRSSGDRNPQLGISKAGDGMMRRLLVQAAHYILGRFGPDTDLRRFGKALYLRGGASAKKRAIVAVARKLAVLLHRLWVTGEVYEPLRQAEKRGPIEESA